MIRFTVPLLLVGFPTLAASGITPILSPVAIAADPAVMTNLIAIWLLSILVTKSDKTFPSTKKYLLFSANNDHSNQPTLPQNKENNEVNNSQLRLTLKGNSR